MTRFDSWTTKYTVILFFILLGAVIFGAVELKLWSQVTDLWYLQFPDFGWEAIEEPIPSPHIVNGYPFFVRRLLTYPFLASAHWLNMDPNVLFSISLPFVAATVVWCIAKIAETFSDQAASLLAISLLIPVSALFFLMDGRIPYALAGYSLVLYAQLAIPNKPRSTRIILACIGILLSSVATGTMLLAFGTVVLLDGYRFLKTKQPSEFMTTCVCTLLFGLPLIWVIDKTFRYYILNRGSIWHTFTHGFGERILEHLLTPIGIAAAAIMLFCAIVAFKYLPRYFPIELLLVSASTFAVGAFGYSMLVLIAVPVTAAIMTFILKPVKNTL